MRTRYDMSASVLIYRSECEGILKAGIETKAWSDKCLAKSVAVTWGYEAYL